MGEALRYRVALRQPHRAQANVLWLFAAMGNTDATVAGAFEVGAAFEELRMWTEATQWYHLLATRFSARSQSGTYARALTGNGEGVLRPRRRRQRDTELDGGDRPLARRSRRVGQGRHRAHSAAETRIARAPEATALGVEASDARLSLGR